MANFYSNISLKQNQIQDAVIHPVSESPGLPVEGQIYYDTDTFSMYYWGKLNGEGSLAWINMGVGDVVYGAGAGISLSTNDFVIDYITATNVVKSAADGTGVTLTDDDFFLFGDDSESNDVVKYGTMEQIKTYISAGVGSLTNVHASGSAINGLVLVILHLILLPTIEKLVILLTSIPNFTANVEAVPIVEATPPISVLVLKSTGDAKI